MFSKVLILFLGIVSYIMGKDIYLDFYSNDNASSKVTLAPGDNLAVSF